MRLWIIPEISDFKEVAQESLEHVCGLVGCPTKSVDLDWQPKFYDFGLVGYFAKIEPGRIHKHFIWSSDCDKWIGELIEEIANKKGTP